MFAAKITAFLLSDYTWALQTHILLHFTLYTLSPSSPIFESFFENQEKWLDELYTVSTPAAMWLFSINEHLGQLR